MLSGARDSPEGHSPPGVVELREDVPLKASAATGGDEARCAGPRLILLAFAVLSAAITLALLTQIYYGDYEVVPHGSVSSSAAACSRAGTDALKAGGRAMDAAAAAALCLAVLAPHRTSLDASGSLLYWEYRQSRTQQPTLFEWGGPKTPAALPMSAAEPPDASAPTPAPRPPRLVAALASLHARFGALPWARVLQPAIELSRNGFNVSEGLALVEAAAGGAPVKGALRTAPKLANFLQTLQLNTSAELTAAWGPAARVAGGAARAAAARGWRAWAGGAGAAVALAALAAALAPPPADPDDAERRVVSSLQQAAADDKWPPSGVATGLAVVDRLDTYVALVAGLSAPFGSGPETVEGWTRDEPGAPLDLAPAIITDENICGTRYVVGAESSGALAQGAAALVRTGAVDAVERARVELVRGGALARQATLATLATPAGLAAALAGAAAYNASPPFAAVNVVRQRADALLSYADSRGGGYASRF